MLTMSGTLPMNTPIVIEAVINAPPDAVWNAVTSTDRMRDWQFDIKDFKPVPGFEFTFLGGPEGRKYLHVCKVTDAVPARKIAYSWYFDGYGGMSQVSFEMFPAGAGTRLRLTHAGVDTFPASNPDFAKQNFVMGWTAIVQDIKTELELK